MKIGFVCTNYNNSVFTEAAVASLYASSDWKDLCVVVVDNNSKQQDIDSLLEMKATFPGMSLVLNQTNVGYFSGLNIGINYLRAQWPDVELVIVGNNDLTFPENFVESIKRHREVFREWAVVAPDLVTPDGTHQNPHVVRPLSKIRKGIWDLYFSSYPIAVLIRHAARVTRRFSAREENLPGSGLYKVPGPVEQGYGACYLLGPVFFRHFSWLCAPTFLMQEEFFLYEQLKEIGQLTYYDPRFVVCHHGHAAINRLAGRQHWRISAEAHRVYKRYLAMTPEDQRRFIMAGKWP